MTLISSGTQLGLDKTIEIYDAENIGDYNAMNAKILAHLHQENLLHAQEGYARKKFGDHNDKFGLFIQQRFRTEILSVMDAGELAKVKVITRETDPEYFYVNETKA